MVQYRTATAADIPAIHACWLATEFPDDAQRAALPLVGVAPWFAHLLAHGTMLVATADDQVIGFAATITRGTVRFLAECFILPAYQSQGISRELLRQLYDDWTGVRSTLASGDRRAVSRYVRAGMTPRWTRYVLSVSHPERIGTAALHVQPCTNITNWLANDRRVLGHDRSVDVREYFLAKTDAQLLEVYAGGDLVAQAIVERAHYSPTRIGALNIAGVMAFGPTHAANAVHSVVHWAIRAGWATVYVRVPGAHPALPLLLDRGMAIVDSETFCASKEWFDQTVYAPTGML
jgi:GNAT superfamily N-acetyltransferase